MDSSDLVCPCPNRAIAGSPPPNCAFVPLQFTRLAIEKKMFFLLPRLSSGTPH